MLKIKPTRANKHNFLLEVIEKCEKKIIDIELEIRLLERRKMAGGNLAGLENQITNDREMINFYKEKIEICQDELKELDKDGSSPKS